MDLKDYKESSTSLVSAKDIQEYICKDNKIITYLVHSRKGEFSDIYIETSDKNDNRNVVNTFRIREEDLIKITTEILIKENIDFQPFSGHGSPLKFINDEFSGIVFSYNIE